MSPRRPRTTLSEPLKKVLAILEQYQNEKGFPPSIRDIQQQGSFSSTSVVNYYLDQLEKMKHIERSGHVSRGIRLLSPLQEALSSVATPVKRSLKTASDTVDNLLHIPIVGRIFAALPTPVPASDFNYMDAESTIDIALSMLPARDSDKELYALEVRGDSMIDAMVYDGDIVVMKPAQEAHNGELVAIWLKDRDETTLKYFYLENGRVRLQPANPEMEPIIINDPSIVEVQGKVVMVVRNKTDRY